MTGQSYSLDAELKEMQQAMVDGRDYMGLNATFFAEIEFLRAQIATKEEVYGEMLHAEVVEARRRGIVLAETMLFGAGFVESAAWLTSWRTRAETETRRAEAKGGK